MSQAIGNEENLAKVRELMGQAQEANLGGALTNGVPIDHTTAFGTHLTGIVEFKRPTMKDYMRMGALKSEELRNAGVVNADLVDSQIRFMAHVISTLKVVVVKCPMWLVKIDEVQEPDILYHVYHKYQEWELSFRKPEASTEASDGDSPASE